MFKVRKRYVIPKTTPECKRLLNMVVEGVKSGIFETKKKESARVALKRLRKKRCVKALEYVMQVSCDSNPLDTFAQEVCNTATEYLKELS